MNRQVTNMFDVRVSDEVATALAEGRAVVAMESTIFSHLGLPSPANEEALSRCEHAVRAGWGSSCSDRSFQWCRSRRNFTDRLREGLRAGTENGRERYSGCHR